VVISLRIAARFIGLTCSILAANTLAQDELVIDEERQPCAAFEWQSLSGVDSYELVVLALPPGEEPYPVIEIQLPATDTSWTPTLDRCLELDRDYLWSIRGVTPEGAGDWLPSTVFRTTDEPREILTETAPEEEQDRPSGEPGPEQAAADRSPGFSPGSIRRVPPLSRLPPGGLRQIGETEKNAPVPVPRQVLPQANQRVLSPESLRKLNETRKDRLPPEIGYESEEEAQAAAAQRERDQRERDQAELARQQNELERERRQEQERQRRERQMPAPVVSAVFDLQHLKIERQREKKGDEYYLVTYKLRGRRGTDDRVYFFDYEKQVWPIVAGDNWAVRGKQFSIPRGAGRLTFENLKPFEVYGFAALLMEANKNSVEERKYAYGFGEFQNEEGVLETLSGAFERAIPKTGALPDYSDTSKANVASIHEQNVEGIINHFGDYRTDGSLLAKSIRDVIFKPLERSNPDVLDGVVWGFSMNIPGGFDWLEEQPPWVIFPPPNARMIFKTDSTSIIGEHLQYETN
jgi:hypothetical protein